MPGDTYDYEQGHFVLIDLSWVESLCQLTIDDRQGAYPELVKERQYDIIFISKQGRQSKSIDYTGKQIQVSAIT